MGCGLVGLAGLIAVCIPPAWLGDGFTSWVYIAKATQQVARAQAPFLGLGLSVS